MASDEQKGGISAAVHDDGLTAIKSGDGDDELQHIKALEQVVQSARAGAEKERNMTLLQGIKLYPKAIMWSLLISTCIVMEGFDMALVNTMCPLSAFPIRDSELTWISDGFDPWNKKYGHQLADGTYQVSAAWQAGLSNVRTSTYPPICSSLTA